MAENAGMTFPLFCLLLGAVVIASGILLLTPLGRHRRAVVITAIVLLGAGVLGVLEIAGLLLEVAFSPDWLPDQS